ncbi:unnamed protein product [Calypogeia fissa]
MEQGTSPRLLIVSDLDNTMVDHQDKGNTSLLRFGSLWESAYRHDSMLVFSTGRSPILYQKLRSEVPLLTPDIAITSVGTEIVYGDTLEADAGWTEELNKGWDRNAVVEEAKKLALKFQDESELRPHKLSFYVEKATAVQIVEELSEKLKARGVNAKLIYSGGQDLDVLPQGAGKGQALAYLLKKFKAENRSPGNTLVCGDSGNDAELFAVADVHGVMVGNAMEELIQWHEKHAKDNAKVFRATERCAAGIIQAMQHFNFTPNIPPRDLSWQELSKKDTQPKDETSRVACEIVEYQIYLEKWLRGQVDTSDSGFWRLIHTMDEKSSLVFAHGTEGNAHLTIDGLRSLHGAVPQFVIWVDRVRVKKLSEGAWSVIFDKWERPTPEELHCKIISSVLVSQAGTPNGLKWVHIHETWLAGYGKKVSG